MLHAQKSATYQPTDIWCQVGDLSASKGNLERHRWPRGDHLQIHCCAGRARWTLMARDMYSINWLICHQVSAVFIRFQPLASPVCSQTVGCFGFGAALSLIASHNRIYFSKAYLVSICLDQSSVSSNRSASITPAQEWRLFTENHPS